MWLAQLQEAFNNLYGAKLRSVLALLGILVGTASVVAMVLIGMIATHETLNQFKLLGTDLLALSISDASEKKQEGQNGLSLADALNLKTSSPNIISVSPYTQLYNPLLFNSHTLRGSILGITESFEHITHITLAQGRPISDLDGYGYFCVIGHDIYDQLQQLGWISPIGLQIQIGKNFFTIVGVAAPWPESNFVYAAIDSSILIPILTSTIISQYAVINNVLIKLTDHSKIEPIKAEIENYFAQQSPGKKLFFRSAKELIASMQKQSEILSIFLTLIGGISLFVGGIGVMNIMLVSVVERRKEMGIRLAIGATSSDIRRLFLFEAVTLSFIGGLLGVILGIFITYIIAFWWHWHFTIFFMPPVIGFLVSVITGIFFGLYPAHQAAKLDPIVALRSE